MSNDDAPLNASGSYQISLYGEEGNYPSLIDISSFLYDFNLLYEFSRLIVDPRYGEYRFSRFSGYRNARRIYPEDRLLVESLRVESPIALIVVVGWSVPSAAAIWALTQAFEKIANFRINRDILKLQREKLILENEKIQRKLESTNVPVFLPVTDNEFREQLRRREADYIFRRMEQRLTDSRIRIKEFTITYVRELPEKLGSNRDRRSW